MNKMVGPTTFLIPAKREGLNSQVSPQFHVAKSQLSSSLELSCHEKYIYIAVNVVGSKLQGRKSKHTLPKIL